MAHEAIRDMMMSSRARRGLAALARTLFAGFSLASAGLGLFTLTAATPLLVTPASAQTTFCQPDGSSNCGACIFSNGMSTCSQWDPTTGKQVAIFTDLSGNQTTTVSEKPGSGGACAAGLTAQSDGSCQGRTQTQGTAAPGSPPVGNPDFGCSTTNGVAACSGCQITNGTYSCAGTDPKTGYKSQILVDLKTGNATNKSVVFNQNGCDGVCVYNSTTPGSPLLSSPPTVTPPPAPPVKTVTAPPTPPPAATPAPAPTPTPKPPRPVGGGVPKEVLQAKQKAIAAKQALEAAKEEKAKAPESPAAAQKPALVTTKPAPPPTKLSAPQQNTAPALVRPKLSPVKARPPSFRPPPTVRTRPVTVRAHPVTVRARPSPVRARATFVRPRVSALRRASVPHARPARSSRPSRRRR